MESNTCQSELEARVAELESTLEKTQERLKKARSQAQETMRELWQMDVKLERAEARATEAEEKLQSGGVRSDNGRVAELEQELEQVRSQLDQMESAPTEPSVDYEARMEEAERRADLAESRLAELEEQQSAEVPEEVKIALHEAEEKARLAEEKLYALQATATNFEDQLREVQDKVREAEADASQWEQKFHRSEERVKEVEREAASGDSSFMSQQVNQLKERLDLSNERAELIKQRCAGFEDRAQMAEERAKTLEEQLKSAQEKSLSAERDLDEYKRQIEDLKAQATPSVSLSNDSVESRLQEVWAKVREAETRANQAEVALAKAASRLKEYEQRANESDRETQRLAFQDTLTGLPNLNLMRQYLDFTVKQVGRYGRASALLVVDLDRFKLINDAMGFKAGDELLMRVSERLQAAIRESDALGRRGEDEFLILLSELHIGDEQLPEAKRREVIEQNIAIVVRRVTEGLARPFVIQGQKFYIRASIGVSVCPQDAESAQQMLEHADSAMYHAKETGRGKCVFYNTDLHRLQERRLTLDNQLRVAMEKGEFELYYQPIVEVSKNRATMVGVEALLRWNHRLEGLLYPDYFLPTAEESGLIVHLGKWVCKQACWQLSQWIQRGLRIFVSINVSTRQMLQADLAETFLSSVQDFALPPELLFVEIAEGVNAERADLVENVVSSLGSAGIRIAIDDFGLGYSSLSRFNLNHTKILKVDASIVGGCPKEKQSVNICTAAVSLAQSLGLRPLAEGVENNAQAKFLAKLGCQFMQGYFFQEPCKPEEITKIAAEKRVWKI